MRKLFLFALAAVLFAACDKSDDLIQDDLMLKKATKIEVCHYDDLSGIWEVISISEKAWEAHEAHGDALLDVDGDGYYPPNECEMMGDYDVYDCDDNDPEVGETCCDIDFFQGFDADTEGWIDYGGTITASEGHGIVEGGAFTRFDGYLDSWTGTWSAEQDVYLDPSWTAGQGFDYSVAANGTDGNHQRDYIFHVSADESTGKLLVGADNNTNFATIQNLETRDNFVEVTSAGWYTMQHIFYESNGALYVDLILLDSNGTELFKETREPLLTSVDADLIPDNIGGNRYGWFTFVSVDGGIMVDNTELFRNCQ